MSDADVALEFNSLAACLRVWPEMEPPALRSPHLRRLVGCLRTLDGEDVGWADVAVLVRQALRVGVESASTRRDEVSVTVPATRPWPIPSEWTASSVMPEPLADGRLRLTAQPWVPRWLANAPPPGVDASVSSAPFCAGLRRRTEGVAADPFLKATFPDSSTDFSTYTSQAHKQAVRTVMSCRPGSTILVNLPTGSGKSTVALAPAFVKGRPVGVSVVVVPTIALALDQERRARELVGDAEQRFAYTQGTSEDDRRAMRHRIRDGVQTVVFVSPESVTRTVSYALFDAARAGHLRYFVVDEAHLVDQWGTEFRPDFQAMAGLRRELLTVQESAGHEPFRTVLMTATVPPTAADFLIRLFGEPGPVEIAVSNLLRPEPEYWVASFDGWQLRREGVVEAARHLPRPAIVYATRREFARDHYRHLQEAGFTRLALFTGETPDADRRQILEDFRSDRIDLVVATSAFGLGVDQDDIRSVIHACIPETIDRYYQEVGRSGRDGRSSVSLICWTAGDRREAHSLAHSKVIGQELGLERWESMFRRAEPLGLGRYRLPVAAKRLATMVDSEENEKWNVRTLGILGRAGLLNLSWEVPPEAQPHPEVSEEIDEFDFGDDDRRLVVELAHGTINGAIWQERVEPQREALRRANALSHTLMLQALQPNAVICELIASAYNLDEARRLPALHHGRPAIVCGGCPAHRSGRVAGVQPLVWPTSQVVDVTTAQLWPLLGRGNVGLLTYEPPTTRRDRERLSRSLAEALRRLVPAGIRLIVAPTEITMAEPLAVLLSHLHHVVPDRVVFLEESDDLSRLRIDLLPALPVVVIVTSGRSIPIEWLEEVEGDPPRVLIVSSDASDPDRTDRRLVDLRPPILPLAHVAGGHA